jgi:hypothetical protein
VLLPDTLFLPVGFGDLGRPGMRLFIACRSTSDASIRSMRASRSSRVSPSFASGSNTMLLRIEISGDFSLKV